MPKTAVPKRPGPAPSTRYVRDRNALMAAALTAGFAGFDDLARAIPIYRENLSKIANGRNPVSARVEAKLRELLPNVDAFLS